MVLSLRKVNRAIILATVFCIPIQLSPAFFTLRKAGAVSNSLFIAIVGIAIWILWGIRKNNGRLILNKYTVYILKWAVYLSIHTLLISMIYAPKVGSLWGETTLTASFSSHIYNVLMVGIIAYFGYAYQFITKEDICRVLNTLIIIILMIGYLQVGIILNFSFAKVIYDILNIGNWLNPSENIIRMGRICLMASEPSAVGNILGLLIFPYCLARREKKENQSPYTTVILLLLPLAFFTFSSTVYVACCINLFIFCCIRIKDKRLTIKKSTFIKIVTVILLATLVFGVGVGVEKKSGISDQIYYYLFVKTSSKENYSTMYRTSTVINDIEIFKDYPLLGVGNGNQGFWYAENIPDWVLPSVETQQALSGEKGVLNGGPFLFAYISAFGIVGLIVLAFFLSYYWKTLKKYKEKLGLFYEMAIISGATFLALATVSVSSEGNFYLYFILSLPLLSNAQYSDSEGAIINRI